ncbi:titin-like [Maniola hyperantus]|uniref:titin-like n=1 Tax=Aphantopus hyperantus TaxID=2795564 RepID=UPI00374A3B53
MAKKYDSSTELSKTKIVLILVFTIFTQTSSSPDAIDDFNRISSSLSQKSSEIKITEEKRMNKIEIKSEGSEQSAFSSQFLHQGHNLFFQPQILIGPGINTPFLSRKIEDKAERKEEVVIHTNKIEPKNNETSNKVVKVTHVLLDIPEAPVLPPLIMPDLPKAVIVQESVIIPPYKEPASIKEIIIEQDTIVIPEPPAFIPLDPPRVPIEVILPKPLPHVPTCLVDSVKYGITVPCPPTIAVSPPIIEKVLVEETSIGLERSPILTLRLPKIPLGIVHNKPIKIIMPYPGGLISTTRFLPSVKVSKIPLKFNHQNVLIPSRSLSEVAVEKIRRERVRVVEEVKEFPSFSAYCAHNIALERVLPNIAVARETIHVEPLPRILEIPKTTLLFIKEK